MNGRPAAISAKREWVLAAFAPLVPVLAGVAAWWLVGDISTKVLPPDQLDHFVDPPAIEPAVENSAGLAAALLASGAVVAAARAVRAGRLRRAWLTLVVVLALCGMVLGWCGRILTAGGIGANIGAGLVLLLAAPALGVALLLCLARALHLARRR